MTQLWKPDRPARPRFGNLALLAFLAVQVLDGALTYVGVLAFGIGVEANPFLRWLMGAVGEAPALTGAKVMAGGLGIVLHVIAVHRLVALLTGIYLLVAVIPWTAVLFVL